MYDLKYGRTDLQSGYIATRFARFCCEANRARLGRFELVIPPLYGSQLDESEIGS